MPVPEARISVEIESAIRLRHPQNDLITPNALISIDWPYTESKEHLETPVIQHSQYPAWHFK